MLVVWVAWEEWEAWAAWVTSKPQRPYRRSVVENFEEIATDSGFQQVPFFYSDRACSVLAS